MFNKHNVWRGDSLKTKNKAFEELSVKLCSLPNAKDTEKVIRYEKSIQKSIFHNLALLKKLQFAP